MRLVESFGKVSEQKMRGRELGIRLISLVILLLSAMSLAVSQDSVGDFEPLWSFGFGGVASVDYSPAVAGSNIAVSGSSTVFILNATNYEIEKQLFGMSGIFSVKWSPDGKYLATGLVDTTINIWEAETGNLVRTLEGHTRQVRSVTWSPDGRYLASGGYNDGTINIWEVATGESIRALRGLDIISSVAWSPDGNYLASNSCGYARIWETKSWDIFREFGTSGACLQSVAWSHDSTYLAAGGFAARIWIWEVESGNQVGTITGPAVDSLAWSPDGNYLAAGTELSGYIFEVGTWNLIRTLRNPPYGGLSSVAWSPESDFLASGGPATVNKWDVATGDLLITVQGHTAAVRSVTWSPDGRQIASGAEQGIRDGSIKIWDVETGNEIRTIQVDCFFGVVSVDWSPDGKYLAATDCLTVKVFEATTGSLIITLQSEGSSPVAWSPDGQYLAAPADRRIRIWKTGTWELVTILEDPPGVGQMTWSPDSRYIAAGPWNSDDIRTIRIFELETGNLIRTIEGDLGITAVSWSPDGKYLASNSYFTINIRDIETGDIIRTLDSSVRSLSWSPDSKYLAAGAPAGGGCCTSVIKIWEVETGTLIRRLSGHTDHITSVKWSRDGRYIASGSWDGTVRLWGEGPKE